MSLRVAARIDRPIREGSRHAFTLALGVRRSLCRCATQARRARDRSLARSSRIAAESESGAVRLEDGGAGRRSSGQAVDTPTSNIGNCSSSCAPVWRGDHSYRLSDRYLAHDVRSGEHEARRGIKSRAAKLGASIAIALDLGEASGVAQAQWSQARGHRLCLRHSARHREGRAQCAPLLPSHREEAEIEGEWVPRELRHTFVSWVSDQGASDQLIADLVGHKKTSTTRTVYRHQLRPVITTGANLLDEVFEEEFREAE